MSADEALRKNEEQNHAADRFAVKTRLNLNDLLRRKKEEKKIDKKTNLIIVSSLTVVALVVILILSL